MSRTRQATNGSYCTYIARLNSLSALLGTCLHLYTLVNTLLRQKKRLIHGNVAYFLNAYRNLLEEDRATVECDTIPLHQTANVGQGGAKLPIFYRFVSFQSFDVHSTA